MARETLSGYLQTASLVDEDAVVRQVLDATRSTRNAIERVVCLWEPGVILAAKLREALGVPGMGVEQATLFRDKDAMKQAVGAAGIRVPKHVRATTDDEVRAAVEEVGYPAIVKPIAGAGSMDTFRVDDAKELEAALARMGHIDVVNVEEFIDGYGEAEIKGTFSQHVERKYNSVNIFKRAQGQGRIVRVEGLDRIKQLFG